MQILVGFDDDMVILQRENKELGSCPIDKLVQRRSRVFEEQGSVGNPQQPS